MTTQARQQAIREFTRWYPEFRRAFRKFDLREYFQRNGGWTDLLIMEAGRLNEFNDLMKHCLNGEQEYLARAGIERTLQ